VLKNAGVDNAAEVAAVSCCFMLFHAAAAAVQEAEQAPQVHVALDAPAVLQLAAKLADLDVAPDEQLYRDLTDLKDISTPTRAQK
jgi:hypothetical protein